MGAISDLVVELGVGVSSVCQEKLTRDLILGDDALLYIVYVMLIWAALIPATR